MKNFLFMLTILLTFFTTKTLSQCTNNVYGLYYSLTPTCTGSWETVTTCGWRGEYSNINVVLGNQYSFQSSVSSDVVTITTTGGVVLSWGNGTTTWTATFSGTVRFWTHGANCSTGTGCRTRSVMCSGTPPPTPCLDNPLMINMYDSWGDGWNGATYTITDDNTGSVVGTGTLSNGTSGTSPIYCVTDGCYTIVVTSGSYPSEITWTATINGVVYANGGAGTSTQLPINSFCTPPTPEMIVPSSMNNSYSVCQGTLYDNGGSSGNYSVSSDGYTTLYPANVGSQLLLDFTYFNLENNWDFLYVYDGPNPSSPLLGVFTGNVLPGTFISSSADGSLTVRLVSDFSIQYPGFEAQINCLSALPVEMVSYNGVNIGDFNRIEWETASEYNSDYFLVKRSYDGIDWDYVGKVSSIGNSDVGKKYSLDDYRIISTTYYKIIQYDVNGVYKEYPSFSVSKSNEQNKEVVKYIDLSGREVPSTTRGLIMVIYSDGTTKRIFN